MPLLDAGKAIIARAETRFPVYPGDVPEGEPTSVPYLIIALEPGLTVAPGLDGGRRDIDAGFYVVCVSNYELGTYAIADQVRELFTGWKPLEDAWDVWESDLGARSIPDPEVSDEPRYSLSLYFHVHLTRS